MSMPQVGQRAPEVTLPSETGETIRLADFRRRRVILYFFPKADTPGCIKEACAFRDDFESYAEKDAVILGVSPDTVAAQARFKRKYDLPFHLLADADHRVAERYGVWGVKQFMGREHLGVRRTTFVIDEQGKIARVFEGVKPAGHSAEVLAAL